MSICYGLQLIAKIFGGKIKPSNKRREFGRAFLYKKKDSLLTRKFLNTKKTVWMSHEDAVVKLPKKFKVIASTKDSKFTIIENSFDKIYGVQFHPEVTHTDKGIQIFKNLELVWTKTGYILGDDLHIINCAGYIGKPNVDACELAKADCIEGNVLLPLMLAQLCCEKKYQFNKKSCREILKQLLTSLNKFG